MNGVEIWWLAISIASFMNIALLVFSVKRFTQRTHPYRSDEYSRRRALLLLSAIYVAGCAFRSVLPRIDLERICLVDSWLSSMFVGRSVATFAELAIIMQCAILLYEAGRGSNDRFSVLVSQLLIPLILVAEGFSWYAVISTNYLGSVVEEALWTIAGIFLAASFISLWSCLDGKQRHFINCMMLFCAGYVVFMVTVDVPMYWHRMVHDAETGVQYLSFSRGIVDSASACTVSFSWNDWKQEIPWMTLYFTAAVWVSLILPHAPGYSHASRQKRTG